MYEVGMAGLRTGHFYFGAGRMPGVRLRSLLMSMCRRGSGWWAGSIKQL
ncbi:hypothetical protein [Anaerovibrio lipolyticus]|nr:hypothetical protein [Anaerovibrio lipolyticus]